MATNNTASIAQARKLVEQLKMEANIDRIKVRAGAKYSPPVQQGACWWVPPLVKKQMCPG